MTTEQELERHQVVLTALAMFPEEKNITKALMLYNKAMPKEKRIPVFVKAREYKNRNSFDLFDRPSCPVCGKDMSLRRLKPNPDGFKTRLTCRNPECNVALNSEFSLEEWLKVLKEAYESNRNAKES